MEGRARGYWRARCYDEQVALARNSRRCWRGCVSQFGVPVPCVLTTGSLAAFDYDYNALDAGRSNALANAYDNFL